MWEAAGSALLVPAALVRAENPPVTREQLLRLQQLNEKLQQELEEQRHLLENLTRKVSDL